jgi:hypothetical protein
MAPRVKPVFNQLRRKLLPIRNTLFDQIARGQVLVVSEMTGVKQCDLVLRLLGLMSTEGEDPALLASTIAEVTALRDRQLAELTGARVITEEASALHRGVTTADAIAAGLVA